MLYFKISNKWCAINLTIWLHVMLYLLYCCTYLFIEYKRPELRDVYKYVIPQCAHGWRDLGVLLHFKQTELETIFKDLRNDSKECCKRLLSTWLEKSPNATWNQLFSAIDDLPPLSEGTFQGVN